MPVARKAEGFWDFSVRTYRSTDVPEACLSLQNDYGADVNMLLYCCWIAALIGPFDKQLFAAACDFSSNWHDHLVGPLRSARTWMKHTGCSAEPMATEACMELRDQVKSVEFAAEKLQQQVLESLVKDSPGRDVAVDRILADVQANLQLYAELIGIDVSEDVRQKFTIIIEAAFPA